MITSFHAVNKFSVSYTIFSFLIIQLITNLGVSESLTKRRMELYKQVSKHQNTDTAWTLDGRIIALRKVDQRKVVIDSPSDLYKLSN